ncbi:hypothetical protein DACRYDRAFT_24818 [Dacryopinax primogenitus]|uniref:Uncharacterized protein n=1 Tax=Dacryopinax primogenitus (strain DJM 731) TaxID=1858805 RepID=M5FNS6_DACPD|nr:uncharacterized protein DACRYDRAFT_24818 [Dacryopinax primogenitus]EJT97875.1 hypothetical protein DACRYDRAFT_24818 [Dacryopinax primogenitus]
MANQMGGCEQSEIAETLARQEEGNSNLVELTPLHGRVDLQIDVLERAPCLL